MCDTSSRLTFKRSNPTDFTFVRSPATRMTLTIVEIVRAVIKRLKISESLKKEWLLRRSIKPGRVYTKREFRALRRSVMPFINACVDDLNAIISNGGIDRAETNYYNRTGEAPVDMVFNVVSQHVTPGDRSNVTAVMPPVLRRTCTGFFGYNSTPEAVAFKEWEE